VPDRRSPRLISAMLERDDDAFGLGDFVTHWLPLDDEPTAYANFQARQYQTIKLVLQP
jgi:threonine dehydrogenase-like Zn-dependent dehydrogenase